MDVASNSGFNLQYTKLAEKAERRKAYPIPPDAATNFRPAVGKDLVEHAMQASAEKRAKQDQAVKGQPNLGASDAQLGTNEEVVPKEDNVAEQGTSTTQSGLPSESKGASEIGTSNPATALQLGSKAQRPGLGTKEDLPKFDAVNEICPAEPHKEEAPTTAEPAKEKAEEGSPVQTQVDSEKLTEIDPPAMTKPQPHSPFASISARQNLFRESADQPLASPLAVEGLTFALDEKADVPENSSARKAEFPSPEQRRDSRLKVQRKRINHSISPIHIRHLSGAAACTKHTAQSNDPQYMY